MTKLLEKAYKEISKLPDSEQDKIAKWIIEKIENIGLYKAMLEGKKGDYVKEETILKELRR